MGGAWLIYLQTKPSDAERLQLKLDATIRNEVCERIDRDIERFKETPHAYRRSSLASLLRESRETAKALIPDIQDGTSVQFKGKIETLVSPCEKQARQWVKIPTAFPDEYENEVKLVGLPQADSKTAAANTVDSTAIATRQNRRLALVIGNSAYSARPLKNPANDARDVAEFLRSVQFDVQELYDSDLAALRSAVYEFSQRLPNYDAALVYYSGHGIEFGGRNYFLPVNADIQAEDEIPRQAFDATEIAERMSKGNTKASILIIDACRNSPVFSKFRSATAGLKTMEAASGMVIAFSAAPGQVASDGNGRNSTYTAALLRQMRTPGRKIEDVLKETRKAVTEESGGRQVPWYNSSLVGDFLFLEQ